MMGHANRSSCPGPDANPEPTSIRAKRIEAGLTQREAARLIYATERAWQEWESAGRRMHPGLWELFCIKLDQIGRAYTRPATDPS